VTDAGGNYRFTNLAAGTYRVGFVPADGYARTTPTAAPGTQSVTLTTSAPAASGVDFGAQLALADLQVANLIAPAAAEPGEQVQVSWTVRNEGSAAITATWQDAIYLSSSPTLDATATLIATVSQTAGLASHAQYAGTANVRLPAVLPGNYYLIVDVDRRYQVPNENNRANNVLASPTATTLTIPTLTLDAALAGQFAAAGETHYYQITPGEGQSLTVALANAATSGTTSLYVSQSGLPTRANFDLAGEAAQAGQSVTIPTTGAGTYYILVESVEGAAATASFTVTASIPTLAIESIDVASGGNTGQVTVGIKGARFTSATQVQFVSGTMTIDAASIAFQDSTLLYATFDLAGRPTGVYDVKATVDSSSTALASAFTVTAGQGNPVQIYLAGPANIRNGRWSSVLVEYVNTSNTDVVAPLLELNATNCVMRLDGQDTLVGDYVNANVQFLGVAPDGPAGVLRPGQSGSMRVYFKTIGGEEAIQVDLQVSVLADPGEAMDWASMKARLRRDYIAAEDWDGVYAILTANLGPTSASYIAALAADATYFNNLGERTADVSRLFEFEVEKAYAAYTASPLARIATDDGVRPKASCNDGGNATPDLGWAKAWLDFFKAIGAVDPNDIVGPIGAGEEKFVADEQAMPYTIDFENVSTATAPAQEVFITEQLDASLDWSTFTLGSFGFGSITVNVPGGRSAYVTSIDTTNPDGTPLRVNVSASLNKQTGLVTWSLRCVDPATGELPEDALAGFLPPNDSTGRGQGYVTYTVRPKAGLATGTVIHASASVVFDVNSPVVTNTYSNTIDAVAPTSSVAGLPACETSTDFTVTWSGSDDTGGAGVGVYDVYVSDNGGAYATWMARTPDTSGTFTGVSGHRYRFYSVATDSAGNRQATPSAAQASTLVDAADPSLDIDGNGACDALTDGILILRYLFDASGAWNYSDALGPGAYRTNRVLIRNRLDLESSTVLDVDGNGMPDALTDGILILRYLFDPAGAWNYSDALGAGATRTTRAEIRAYLAQWTPDTLGSLVENSVDCRVPNTGPASRVADSNEDTAVVAQVDTPKSVTSATDNVTASACAEIAIGEPAPDAGSQPLADWAAVGLPGGTTAGLTRTHLVVADLPDAEFGRPSGDTIYLDRDTAGYGELIDLTLAEDEEFAWADSGRQPRALDFQTVDRIHLSAVIEGELANAAALDDLDLLVTSLTSGKLRRAVG
jgi:hypothetical protein